VLNHIFIVIMKEKSKNTNHSPVNEFVKTDSEWGKPQEFDEGDYVEDNFYSFPGDDHRGLVEEIKKWESFRYMI
jgi:hypothetical protein